MRNNAGQIWTTFDNLYTIQYLKQCVAHLLDVLTLTTAKSSEEGLLTTTVTLHPPWGHYAGWIEVKLVFKAWSYRCYTF